MPDTMTTAGTKASGTKPIKPRKSKSENSPDLPRNITEAMLASAVMLAASAAVDYGSLCSIGPIIFQGTARDLNSLESANQFHWSVNAQAVTDASAGDDANAALKRACAVYCVTKVNLAFDLLHRAKSITGAVVERSGGKNATTVPLMRHTLVEYFTKSLRMGGGKTLRLPNETAQIIVDKAEKAERKAAGLPA